MSETSQSTEREMTREQEMAALFAHMVMQQTNMAMMLLGKMPHPETGKTFHDIDTARMFIDQLEMLEVKTKGNLSKQEEGLLKQSLMNLRLAFVEAVEQPPAQARQPSSQDESKPSASPQPEAAPTASTQEEESKKKFSKKY